MTKWLIDTNVISESRRPRPSIAVANWIADIELDDMFTTAVNIAELRYGTVENADDKLEHFPA